MSVTLLHGDCLDLLPTLLDHSFDAIIADLPYGTTACKWDTVIPFEPLWAQYRRLIKERGAIALFGSQPFTSALVMSNVEWFKYCWDWDKVTGKGHLVANIRPLQQTEQVAVFGTGRINYYPIMTARKKPKFIKEGGRTSIMGGAANDDYKGKISYARFPKTILRFPWSPSGNTVHPTQKPVALLEYLIRTYTNPGDIVLDNTMGSGTTGVACIHTGRSFVGIEREREYFDIAQARITHAQNEIVQMELVL